LLNRKTIMSSYTKNPPLVTLAHGQPVTSTLAMAEGTDNEHASVIKLVRNHLNDYEEFGLVRFEIRPREPGRHGGGDAEYALLNEPQATLLITYMRNSPVVREFKKRLVREFFAMAEQLRDAEALRREDFDEPPGFPDAFAEGTCPTGSPFDLVESSKLGNLFRLSRSAANAYLIRCGVTPGYVAATLAEHAGQASALAFNSPSLVVTSQAHGSVAEWWRNCLETGQIGAEPGATEWPRTLPCRAVQTAYADWCRLRHLAHVESTVHLGASLHSWGVRRERPGVPKGEPRPWWYVFPPLDMARRLFAESLANRSSLKGLAVRHV